MTDIRITFEPAGVSTDVATGTTIAHAVRAAGLVYGTSCGDSAICGRCRVAVEPASAVEPPEALEVLTSERQGLEPNERLACVARLRENAVVSSPLWRRQ